MGFIGDLYLIMVLQTPWSHPQRPNWPLWGLYSESGDKTLPEYPHFSWKKKLFCSKLDITLPVGFMLMDLFGIVWLNKNEVNLVIFDLKSFYIILKSGLIDFSITYLLKVWNTSIGQQDNGDSVMSVTVLRCCWQNRYGGDFFNVNNRLPTPQIEH